MGELSGGEVKRVAITQMLASEADFFIMDEPTASLSQKETEALFKVVQKLKKDGVTIMYVSHRLEENSDPAE